MVIFTLPAPRGYEDANKYTFKLYSIFKKLTSNIRILQMSKGY